MSVYNGIYSGLTKEAGPIKWLARRAAAKRAKKMEPLLQEAAKSQAGRARKGVLAGAALGAGAGAATADPGDRISGALKGGLVGGVAGGGIGALAKSKVTKANLAKVKKMQERTDKGKIFV